jgi:hypothetical protein
MKSCVSVRLVRGVGSSVCAECVEVLAFWCDKVSFPPSATESLLFARPFRTLPPHSHSLLPFPHRPDRIAISFSPFLLSLFFCLLFPFVVFIHVALL